MSTADLPIENINESTIERLIDDGVPAGVRLEYKRELADGTEQQKKEFLRDVSAFANTAGGDILYGISENKGVPATIEGLAIENTDKLSLQIDQIIRDGLEPKLAGHRVHPIRLQSGKYVILLRIPRSFAAPHRVSFKSTPQFWARRSNGKYYLEINELRNAFLLSETAAERIRNFRADRVAKVLAGQGPVVLQAGPKLIVHLVPIEAFHVGHRQLDPSALNQSPELGPYYHAKPLSLSDPRYNLDGLLSICSRGGDPFAYSQWFVNGIVESVNGLNGDPDGRLHFTDIDRSPPMNVRRWLDVQAGWGVRPPIILMVTITDVRNCHMVISRSYQEAFGPNLPVDRDHLFIPEVFVESFDTDLTVVLGPLLDTAWRAFGFEHSPVGKQA